MLSIDLLASLPNFLARFGTNEACRAHLFALRWPDGFSCRRCAWTRCYAHTERIIYECSQCGMQHSLLAGTFFEQTKIALAKWFLAIYLFIGSKGAISGTEFKRHLGFKSDQTAWAALHKLRSALRHRAPPSGAVEVDTAFLDAIEHLFEDKGKGPWLEKTRISDEVRLEVVTRTAKERPNNAKHWSARILAQEMGLGHSTVQRIWNEYGLKPHLTRSFKLSNDPQFVEKIVDIVGLYLEPPEHAVVHSVDKKSQIRALDCTQLGLPKKKGLAATMTHDHNRNGTTIITLFATLVAVRSIAAVTKSQMGEVIGESLPGHRAKDFIRFLKRIDRTVTRDLDVHVVCNKNETHNVREVKTWLERHKRFKVHFTPTPASWLNLVERLFAGIVSQRIARGVFKSVVELKGAIDVNGLVVAGAPYLVKFFRSYSDPKHRPRPRPSHAGETRPARAPR